MSDKPLVLFTDHKVLTAKRAPDEPGRHDVIDFLGFLSALPFRPLGRFLVFRYNPHLCLKLISSIYASIPPNDSK
jgi:UDP-3-O-acyl-N-acetylglucosamine deacetylase